MWQTDRTAVAKATGSHLFIVELRGQYICPADVAEGEDNVGAQRRVHVFRQKATRFRSKLRPVGVVAHPQVANAHCNRANIIKLPDTFEKTSK